MESSSDLRRKLEVLRAGPNRSLLGSSRRRSRRKGEGGGTKLTVSSSPKRRLLGLESKVTTRLYPNGLRLPWTGSKRSINTTPTLRSSLRSRPDVYQPDPERTETLRLPRQPSHTVVSYVHTNTQTHCLHGVQ